MNRKKKILKIFAAVAAFIMIGVVLFFASVFFGNPISYLIVKNSAENIIEENYPDKGYEIESISYLPIDTCYEVGLVSPASIDSRFSMIFDFFGEFMHDDYKSSVLHKGNIRERIEKEYAGLVMAVLETPAYPYETGHAFGTIDFADDESNSESNEGKIAYDELEADKVYDMKEIGERAGVINLEVWDDEITVEKAAEILKKTKQMLNSADVRFYSVNFGLWEKKTDEANAERKRIHINGFLADDICEEDFIDKINLNIKYKGYYNESDDEKTTEIGQYENELISQPE